jgi:hypothetical protein
VVGPDLLPLPIQVATLGVDGCDLRVEQAGRHGGGGDGPGQQTAVKDHGRQEATGEDQHPPRRPRPPPGNSQRQPDDEHGRRRLEAAQPLPAVPRQTPACQRVAFVDLALAVAEQVPGQVQVGQAQADEQDRLADRHRAPFFPGVSVPRPRRSRSATRRPALPLLYFGFTSRAILGDPHRRRLAAQLACASFHGNDGTQVVQTPAVSLK